MELAYHFLDLLGLNLDACERDIRRAYARQLKSIDQENNQAGFQRLRDAYESALEWAAWKAGAADAEADTNDRFDRDVCFDPDAHAHVHADAACTDETALTAPQAFEPAAGKPLLANSAAIGRAAFARLEADLDTLALHPAAHPDWEPWVTALLQYLEADELVSIDARTVFEANLVIRLAEGWQPGHDHLFDVAGEVFDWSDGRSLARFGQHGAFLDRAVTDASAFKQIDPEHQLMLQQKMQALRLRTPIDARQLRADQRDIELMMVRFPALMHVTVGNDNVDYWRNTCSFFPDQGAALEIVDQQPLAPMPKPFIARMRSKSGFHGVSLALILLLICAFFDVSSERQPHQARGLVPQHVLERHMAPVRYQTQPHVKPGLLTVALIVFLDKSNRVMMADITGTSGDEKFDEAVRQALQEATPFPAGTPKMFGVDYAKQIEPAKPAPAMQSPR
jgi:hypothetical protein